MKYILIFLLTQNALAQKTPLVKSFPIPHINAIFFDFEILDSDYSLVPINGGLFCPESNSWFEKPTNQVFNSVSYFSKEKKMNYSILRKDTSFIFSTKIISGKDVNKDSIILRKHGLFFCKQLSPDTLIYGGLANKRFLIYTYTKEKETELFSFSGRVNNVQFLDNSSFYFQVKNNIYFFTKGYAPKRIYSSQNTIYGFCVDSRGNLFISRKEGVFQYLNNSVRMILPFVYGFLKISNNKLYIISFHDSMFIKVDL